MCARSAGSHSAKRNRKDIHVTTTPSSLAAPIRSVVQRVLRQRDWRLLEDPALGVSLDEFSARVERRVAELQAQDSILPQDQLVEPATINQYCHLLHDALRSTAGSLHERVMTELSQYLRPMVIKKGLPAVADDLTDQTLLIIWREFCNKPQPMHDPGAFLDWCTQILIHEIAHWGRGQERQPQQAPWPDEDEIGENPLIGELPSIQDDTFWAVVKRCLQNARYFAVIQAVFAQDMRIQEIAARLQVRPNLVSLDKFRALDRLRRCPELVGWNQEDGR